VTTDLLLLFGVAAAICSLPLFSSKVRFDPAMTPTYHTGSELELGARGWVQRASFLLMGAGGLAFAVGVYWILDTIVGAVLLAIFGLGLMVAGAFTPDAVRGYPPGAQSEPSTKPTWRALVHAVIRGPVAFLAIFGACLTIASHLEGAWRLYTLLTAVAGLTMTIWTVLAFRRDAANTGLVQRGLILIYWTWIVVVGSHLIAYPP
jgi:vacuolar-type H+-ATPase subunit I/STV1